MCTEGSSLRTVAFAPLAASTTAYSVSSNVYWSSALAPWNPRRLQRTPAAAASGSGTSRHRRTPSSSTHIVDGEASPRSPPSPSLS